MNSFAKRIAKAAVTGIVLSSVLMTTACGSGNQSVADAPQSPVQSQSVDVTPTATPTPTKASTDTIGPWDINIDDVVAKQDPSVAKVFPNESKDDLKEGVLFALNTYQGLVNIKNFYKPRTTSDNTLLLPNADKFDKTFYDAMTERATKNGGRFEDIITFAPANGSISKDYIMDPTKDVNFTSGPPILSASSTEGKGNDLVVKANAIMYAPTADGKLVTLNLRYWIGVNHVGSGKWLVSDLGYKITDSAITDSVAAPEAPNEN